MTHLTAEDVWYRTTYHWPLEEGDEALLGWRMIQHIVRLADRLDVSVLLGNRTLLVQQIALHTPCSGYSVAPMWNLGFICLDHRLLVAPVGELVSLWDTHLAHQLLHELSHVALQDLTEEGVAEWEIYAAMVMYGHAHPSVLEVISYQSDALTHKNDSAKYQRLALARYTADFPRVTITFPEILDEQPVGPGPLTEEYVDT